MASISFFVPASGFPDQKVGATGNDGAEWSPSRLDGYLLYCIEKPASHGHGADLRDVYSHLSVWLHEAVISYSK